MIPFDLEFRRGLALLLTGMGLLVFANFVLLMGVLVGTVAAGGAGGFVVSGLGVSIVGLVIVFIGAAILGSRPSVPR